MKQVIVIKTDPSRLFWLERILKSLEGYSDYPIIVLNTYEYLFFPVIKYIKCDEFVFLHDSMEITDTKMFDICFKEHLGKNVAFIGNSKDSHSVYQAFAGSLGKFCMKTVRKLKEPSQIVTKQDDYKYEDVLVHEMAKLDPDIKILNKNWSQSDFEEVMIGDRKNHKLVTPYYIKYRSFI